MLHKYNYLFPTCVFSETKKDLADELLPVAEEYLNLHGESFSDYKTHISTYRNREVTDKLNSDPRIGNLYRYILSEARAFLDFQNVDSSEYTFRPSFLINKVGKGSTHLLHSHPGSVISGCFYLKTCEDSPPIIFKDPREYYKYIHYTQIFGRNSGYSLFPESVFNVHDGLLLMWPSWLEHEVPLSSSDGDRITIAFNLDK